MILPCGGTSSATPDHALRPRSAIDGGALERVRVRQPRRRQPTAGSSAAGMEFSVLHRERAARQRTGIGLDLCETRRTTRTGPRGLPRGRKGRSCPCRAAIAWLCLVPGMRVTRANRGGEPRAMDRGRRAGRSGLAPRVDFTREVRSEAAVSAGEAAAAITGAAARPPDDRPRSRSISQRPSPPRCPHYWVGVVRTVGYLMPS